ncbi:MAG: hypothetical protein D3916_18735, partial [Candidatus Electrothrix sp. MAN1_4]|nr:hypothetical protein [Candidatus Electrothrix sp. MAN1_4]
YTLPHTMFWCLGIAIWFCAVGAMTAPKKQKSHRFVADFIVLFIVFILSTAFFGPCLFGLLAIIAFARTINGFLPSTRKTMSKESKRNLNTVNAMVLIGITAGLAVSMHTIETRTDADFVLQWGSGYQSKMILRDLVARKDTVQLQRILAETKDKYLAEEVAEALATITEEGDEFVEDAQ